MLVGLRRLLAAPAFLVVGVAISYVPACDDRGHDAAASDVVFEGGTNDEALAKLEAAKATTDAAKGHGFTSPAADAKLPATPIPAFAWKANASALVARPLDGVLGRRERPRLRAPLAASPFGAERAASAHGAPLSGRAYLVGFSATGPEPLLRVFTTATAYTPDAASWEKLRGASGAISATITTASFDNNNLVQDAAPIRGAPLTFTIQR